MTSTSAKPPLLLPDCFTMKAQTTNENASPTKPGPWRITFDTNPDDCNLRYIMCEDHSPYSTTQTDRRNAGLPKKQFRKLLRDAGFEIERVMPTKFVSSIIEARPA